MGQDWIIGVLRDLRLFARANGMPLLSRQLEETTSIALCEIAAKQRTAGGGDGPMGGAEVEPGQGH